MAESVIGALSVKITADAQGVRDGVKAAGNALEVGGKKLRNSVNEFGKWAAAGTLAAGGITAAMVKMNLTAIRELKNTAFAADTTVAAFQRGAFAAEQFGISQEKYGDILKDVNDRVGDFLISGAGPMVDFFEQIAPKVGITAEAFKGLSGQQSMALYVKSLQDANVSQQEMTFFMEAMASDSTRLLPLFRDNAKQLHAMSEEAKALGIGLSDIDVAKAELASRELSKSAGHIDALTKQFTVELAPILVAVSQAFDDMAKSAGGAGNVIQNAINGVISTIGVFADGVHGVKLIFKGLEVIALGVVGAITSSLEALTTGFAVAIDGVLGIANDAITAINNLSGAEIELIPSIQDSEFMKGLHADGNAFREIVANAGRELHAMAMQELPSDQIKAFVEEAKVEFEQMAVALDAATNPKKKEGEGEGVGTKEQSEIGFIEAETIGILEALNLRYTSQEEAELSHLMRQKEMNDRFLSEKRITEKEHSDEMARIKQAEEDVKRKITMNNIQQGFQALVSNSKKAQKFMKGAAVVQAVIKGKQAAVDAWQAGMSTGGPFAPVVAAGYAAASIAKTASMISSIKSGGSSMGGSSGGGANVSTPSAGATGGGQQQQQASRNISINMKGSGVFSSEQVRELIGQINNEIGDGVNLATGI